jgi:peptidyl-prolyl cis-trans isomerase C
MNLTLSDRRPALRGPAFYRVFYFGLACCLVAAFVFAAPLARAQDDPVVARVDGADIRQSDLAMAEEDLGAELQRMPPEQKRENLIRYVARVAIVAKAAEAKKTADSADFKRRDAFARKKLLMISFLEAESKAAVTDGELRKFYDVAIKDVKPVTEIRARHILVKTEDEAKAIHAELQKGADFAELAKSRSKDPGSGAQGGDLDYMTEEDIGKDMVPEFGQAVLKLEPGKLSDPVKTQFGWHLIRVEDKRQRPLPKFEDVRAQIENHLARQAQMALITSLEGAAKIERLDAPKTEGAPAEQKK